MSDEIEKLLAEADGWSHDDGDCECYDGNSSDPGEQEPRPSPHCAVGMIRILAALAREQQARIAEQDAVYKQMDEMATVNVKEVDYHRAKIEEMRAQIAELTTWRPMETAPRDGTRIQMLTDGSPNYRVRIAKFDAGAGGWYFDGFSDPIDDRKSFRHILGWLPLLPGVGAESATAPEVSLDEKGRCCGRKPLHYKRPSPHYFCCRCDRQYGPDGQWRPNWAWVGPHERSARGEAGARAKARATLPAIPKAEVGE